MYVTAAPPKMLAIHNRTYGPPEALRLEEVPTPAIAPDQVLLSVRAASLNPLDWHVLRGQPYVVRAIEGWRRPKVGIPGVDVAGIVAAVGDAVTEFEPGDEVFGAREATLAEYVAARERNLVPKPARLSFEEAAAIPVGGVTALMALRDKGELQPGQRVLINGAAGGVGTLAVQIAKALGAAEVTGVCSTRNVALVRSIGADHVVDYTAADFTSTGQLYDLIIDNIGNHSLPRLRRALTPTGTAVLVGGNKVGNWVGPLVGPLKATVYSRLVGQRLLPMLAKVRKEDIVFLAGLVEDGKLTPVVDRTYALGEAAAAMRYLETGHARGKIVIAIAG